MGTAIGEALGGPLGYAWSTGPVREIREQAGAASAVGLFERISARYPEDMRGYQTIKDIYGRLRKKAGY